MLDGRTARVELTGLAFPGAIPLPGPASRASHAWHERIDEWAVDWDCGGGAFAPGWFAFRARRRRTLPLVSGPHAYATPGPHTIRVRAIDVFGNAWERHLVADVE